MKRLLFTAAVLAFSLPAWAYCPTHNPLDLRCSMADFSAPIGTVQWYLNSEFDRRSTLIQCGTRFPPPRAWCAAAAQANLLAYGTKQRGW